jgi:hypothetical protein
MIVIIGLFMLISIVICIALGGADVGCHSKVISKEIGTYLKEDIIEKEDNFMNLVKTSEIGIGDLVETFDGKVGLVTDISKRGICLSTISDDIKIFCKDIKKIRFLPPKCLRHKKRKCEICNFKIKKIELGVSND